MPRYTPGGYVPSESGSGENQGSLHASSRVRSTHTTTRGPAEQRQAAGSEQRLVDDAAAGRIPQSVRDHGDGHGHRPGQPLAHSQNVFSPTTTHSSSTPVYREIAAKLEADGNERFLDVAVPYQAARMAPGNPDDEPRIRRTRTYDLGERLINDVEPTTTHAEQRGERRAGPAGASSLSPRRANQYISDPPGRPTYVAPSVTLQPQSTRQILQREKAISDADEDLKAWRDRKEHARLQRQSDQREDLQQLQDYSPWGKPGAGAPNSTCESYVALANRSQDFASNVESEMTLPLGSKLGGGGEVSRTSSGKPITKLRAHPETRFQDSTATNALPSSYYAAKQVSQDSVTSQQQHNRRNPRLATVDERMETAFFPFGRPGCGAPLKTGNGGLRTTLPNVELEDSQREEMLRRRREAQRYRERLNEQTDDRRDKQEPNTISPPSVYDPWGKGIGNVDRDSAGFTRAPPKRHDPYDTALKSDGLEHHERYATLQSMRDAAERSRADRLQNRRTRPVDPPPPSINSDGTPNNTTADWLSGMQVGRAQRDPLTDKVIAGDRKRVQDLFASGSEAPISPRRRTEMEKQELHDHLSEQAEQRQRIKDEARAREKEETAKHMATLDSMFGRPGCGAPLRDDRGRVQAGRQRGNELAVEGYKADTTAVRL